jgi:hypothetical protein
MVPRGSVRWAHVPSGALNQDATPLSVRVTDPAMATAGGTTASRSVVSGVNGVLLDVVAGAGAGRTAVVVVVVGGGGAVVAGALRVVGVDAGRGGEVVGDDRSRRTRSGREMASATAASCSVAGGSSAPSGDPRAGEPAPIAVAVSTGARRRATSPETSVTTHSTAT